MIETIGLKELHEIIGCLHIGTIKIYLQNYRFNKFRMTYSTGHKARYKLDTEFLNLFYTYLLNRNRVKAANRLAEHFKDFDLTVIDWEDFICGNTH